MNFNEKLGLIDIHSVLDGGENTARCFEAARDILRLHHLPHPAVI